jgi:hypothetical protein
MTRHKFSLLCLSDVSVNLCSSKQDKQQQPGDRQMPQGPVHRVTATRRNQAFQSLAIAMEAIARCRAAKTDSDREFELAVIRESIVTAKAARLRRFEYPSIP